MRDSAALSTRPWKNIHTLIIDSNYLFIRKAPVLNQYFIIILMARKHIQLFIFVLSSYKGNVFSLQAESKQISLEKQLQVLRETDHMLQVLKESLGELDKQLTTYLTDRIDAFQLPQEAQVLPRSLEPLCSEKEPLLASSSATGARRMMDILDGTTSGFELFLFPVWEFHTSSL